LDDYQSYGLTEGVEYEVDLEGIVKDMGVSIVNPEENRNVKLAVRVSTYDQKSGTIEFDYIELKGKSKGLKYSAVEDTIIPYELSGLITDLEILDISKLNFILDVTDLEPGTHTVKLKLETTQRVKLQSNVSVKIRIEEE
jgi:YbbR domain-containing protein